MKKGVCALLTMLTAMGLHAQKIVYNVSFPNAVHHEARVQMEVSGSRLTSFNFRMSRSSPGRYATHEFGKNVYDVSAKDAFGKEVPVTRVDGDVWQVSGVKNTTVTLSYTLYGNYADGTYSGIDANSIHLNMPATFMWIKELQDVPIEVNFQVPDTSFSIATQLKPGETKNAFTAPNLQYLMDSPTKIGKLQWRQWTINNGTRNMTMRLALETDAPAAQVDSMAESVKRIAQQAKAVFGEYPVYDFGTYTFIASINPYVYGDGMEHRNSTMITTGRPFSLNPRGLGVFAHEFFHCWNVERIRPATLEPFNFEKSNMSNELWCAEGFTQYYGQLLMMRAGVLNDIEDINGMTSLIQAKLNTPGADKYTPIEASNEAVFVDAGVAVDKTNFQNISTSYYTYGGAIALALDLTLRKQGKSLDQFMQQMWKVHGKLEKPYTVADMQTALAVITSAAFAKEFFDTYVYAPGKPNYESLLAQAGYALQKAAPGKAYIGNLRVLSNVQGGVAITSNTLRGTPLYDAGLDVGDTLIIINGSSDLTDVTLSKLLNTHKPGDKLTVTYKHRNDLKQTTLITIENPTLALATYESLGRELSNEQKAFRNNWLGAKQYQ